MTGVHKFGRNEGRYHFLLGGGLSVCGGTRISGGSQSGGPVLFHWVKDSTIQYNYSPCREKLELKDVLRGIPKCFKVVSCRFDKIEGTPC